MRTPTQKQRPRKVQVDSFPAPTGGKVSNRNLAISRSPDQPPGAAILENWFPTATGIVMRRGTRKWATLVDDSPIRSLFTYSAGGGHEFFSATDTAIYDITISESSVGYVVATGDDDYVSPDPVAEQVIGEANLGAAAGIGVQTGGEWVTVQFATAGGEFLIGVNGTDPAFVYNGTVFAATSITFPLGSTLTTADLSYVWVYKQRIWFIEKNSLNAWYLPVDSIGGELTLWPMGGIFVRGGTLLWGQAWSLEAGGAGGLSEQCVFTTTEGEVAAYQGLSPDPDQGWSKVGVYRIGTPLGKQAFIRAGGDLVIATSVGFISLASASSKDYAALGQGAVSYPIEADWTLAVQERGQIDWRCQVWADGRMALIAPPVPESKSPVIFVVNTNTGKWAEFTGWNVTALAEFNGGLFFGSSNGSVMQAWVGGSDDGLPYVCRALPLFSDMGTPASLKIAKMARAVILSARTLVSRVSCSVNFRPGFPPPPSAAVFPSGNEWDNGIWGQSVWDASVADVVVGDWVSVGGSGHDLSVGIQITSNSTVPIDAELVRMDVTYTMGDVGT